MYQHMHMTPAYYPTHQPQMEISCPFFNGQLVQGPQDHQWMHQIVPALLTGFILKLSHTYPWWTVILLPFKLAACKQVFPNPPIDGMTKMLFRSTKPSCVLWLHSMQMLVHSIKHTAIKVNPTSHMWTHWAASMWCLKNGREKNKTTCCICLKYKLHLSANLQYLVHHPIITYGILVFDKMLNLWFHPHNLPLSFYMYILTV